ncbi:MAG: A/G-specific adenine glycosylase [Chloroflexi bacterium]|nr:A/G-specific adenine glycosylase [Chloroflexota bacterium]
MAAPTVAIEADLHAAILAWFAVRGRDLAFRATADPYAILVSEAMAQQTQAARAADYWSRFLVEFPTVQALAESTPAAVLRAWRGLGYNRRALALRQAAIAIVRDHGGAVPDELEALECLPGVGPYTARAVAALAFGRRVGAVDVNVRRVLSRAIGGSLEAFGTAELQRIADASVPADQPGVWTHALMDVGATFCRARAPRCGGCPAQPWCQAAPSFASPRGQDTPVSPAAPESPVTAPHAAREAPVAFETTSRWLRGRLLDLLRDSPDGAWATLPAAMGSHGTSAIAAAFSAMVAEGLAERHPADPWQARLPLA